MEPGTCILCESGHTSVHVKQFDINREITHDLFALVRCEGCGLIYLNPRPTPEEISAYYPCEYYEPGKARHVKGPERLFKRLSAVLQKQLRQEYYGYPVSGRSHIGRILRRVVLYPEYLRRKIQGKDVIPYRGDGRFLDVGCGTGKMLPPLKEAGWDVYGVDFSPVAANYARQKYDIDVRVGDLLQAEFKEAFFDVIFFSHSLEHMFDPVAVLNEARRILKPRGTLIVHIPNAESWEAKIYGKWWVHWDIPRHLYHFNKQTMRSLLEKSGFRLLTIRYGVGTSSFLGSLNVLHKHVWRTGRCHGRLMRWVSDPFCLIAGHLGYGSEMKVYAEKSSS